MTAGSLRGVFCGLASALAFATGALALPERPLAAASAWWKSEQVQVRLIAANNATGRAERLRFGMQFRMLPGWKIYWRSPGDAGFPPRPDWAGSVNLAEAAIQWPAPTRFEVLGLQTMGYKKEVVLPLAVSVFEPGKQVALKARVPFLACSEICIPYEARLALRLPAGPETSSPEQALIDRYARLVPGPRNLPELSLGRVYVSGPPGMQALLVDVIADRKLGRPDLFVEGKMGVSFGPPVLRFGADGRQALLRVAASSGRGTALDLTGQELTFTLVHGGTAIERTARVAALPPGMAGDETPPQKVGQGYTLALILLFSLLGGLILNLMPCVLPVLSIKLLSVIGHGGGDPRAVRRGFLASAAGIVSSFLVLGTVAVALKAAGLAAGWGIQFQQPVFLVAMVAILVLFCANMWGMFEFRLPGAIGDHAARAGSGHGLGAHFLTGAFATLLATPCSAPFLGTAVGFALSRSAGEIYAVFAALGVGLAAPYLLVAAVPVLVTRLPRPGHWMVSLRRILGIALIGTALWLLTVLATQAGLMAAGLVAALMAGVLVALWQLPGISLRARRLSWGIVAVLVVFALAGVRNFAPVGAGPRSQINEAALWTPFDRGMIAAEVRLGRVVFVDVTADWCITCQVNKSLVLRRGPVAARLRDANVTAMKADWTRPDPRIAKFLAGFGRYGIPFNVVYGPGAPGGIPLPEILTDHVVVSALDRAGEPASAAR